VFFVVFQKVGVLEMLEVAYDKEHHGISRSSTITWFSSVHAGRLAGIPPYAAIVWATSYRQDV